MVKGGAAEVGPGGGEEGGTSITHANTFVVVLLPRSLGGAPLRSSFLKGMKAFSTRLQNRPELWSSSPLGRCPPSTPRPPGSARPD